MHVFFCVCLNMWSWLIETAWLKRFSTAIKWKYFLLTMVLLKYCSPMVLLTYCSPIQQPNNLMPRPDRKLLGYSRSVVCVGNSCKLSDETLPAGNVLCMHDAEDVYTEALISLGCFFYTPLPLNRACCM